MPRRAAILTLALALAAAAPVRAQSFEPTPHSMSAVAVPDKVRLGESFTLTVEISDASEVRYEWPAEAGLGKEFDVVRVTPTRSTKDSVTATRFDVQILLFDLGEKSLGDIVLPTSSPKGAGKLTVPGPKVVGVGDMKEDEQGEISEILPPVDVLVPVYTALWIIGGTLLAALAGLMLWRWLKSRPKRVKVAPIAPRAPLHERALAALEELQKADLPGQGRHKEFYFRLSEILRDYLGERYGFLALDMTTEELLGSLSRMSTPGLDYIHFQRWCQEGDLVKFARLPVGTGACKQAIEEAFGFVQATLPRLRSPGAAP